MEEKQKKAGELRREALFYQPKNGYDRLSAQDEADMNAYCGDYKKFLDAGKTERECVDEAVRLAEAKGFKPFTRGMAVNPGDKFYRVNRGKALMLAVIGTRPLSEGVNIGAGTITCNYDGKNKHRTTIEDGAFIGSNTALVAPVTVGKECLVGAGSVITHDVPAGELAVARGKQKNLPRRK